MGRASDGLAVAVTIAIPVYRPDLSSFRYCLESATVQAPCGGGVEIIVAIDGEAENTELLKSGLLSCFPGIRKVVLPHGGVGRARNELIRIASGDLILFLDADDFLEPDAARRLCDAAINYDADVVFSNHWRVYGDRRVEVCVFEKEERWSSGRSDGPLGVVLSSGTDQGTVWGKVFSIPFLRDNGLFFSTDLSNGEDQEFMVRCVLKSSAVVAISDYTYNYAYNAESAVRKPSDAYPVALQKTMEEIRADLENEIARESIFQIYNLFVLDRLLVLMINYLCHPGFEGGYSRGKKLCLRTLSLEPYRSALALADLSRFSKARRVVLFCAKRGLFFPIWLVCKVRHMQLKSACKR